MPVVPFWNRWIQAVRSRSGAVAIQRSISPVEVGGSSPSAYIPGLADFVPMVKGRGSMALAGPVSGWIGATFVEPKSIFMRTWVMPPRSGKAARAASTSSVAAEPAAGKARPAVTSAAAVAQARSSPPRRRAREGLGGAVCVVMYRYMTAGRKSVPAAMPAVREVLGDVMYVVVCIVPTVEPDSVPARLPIVSSVASERRIRSRYVPGYQYVRVVPPRPLRSVVCARDPSVADDQGQRR